MKINLKIKRIQRSKRMHLKQEIILKRPMKGSLVMHVEKKDIQDQIANTKIKYATLVETKVILLKHAETIRKRKKET